VQALKVYYDAALSADRRTFQMLCKNQKNKFAQELFGKSSLPSPEKINNRRIVRLTNFSRIASD